jgi:multiple sugar transport system permease protein
MRRSPSRRQTVARTNRSLRSDFIAVFFAAFFLLPFYWLIQSTTKDNGQLIQGTFLPGIPNHFVHDNLTDIFAFSDGVFAKWLVNSFIYSIIGSLVSTFLAAMAGFAFRRYRFAGRKFLFSLILGFALVPGFATTLPLFIEFKNLGLINTSWSVIIPSCVNVFGVYLMVVYWNQIPEEMFDAAMIDGAGEFSIFFRIGLPGVLPGLTTLVIIAFVATWNNYFLPLVMLSDSARYPLILGITTINSLEGFPIYNLRIMGAFLTALPLLVIFSVLQRFLAPQLTGAIK